MHGWWWSEGGDGGGLGNSTDGGSQKALGPVDWAVIVVHLGLSIVVGLLATRHSSKDGEVGAVSYHGRNGRCVPPFPPLLFHSPAVRFTRSPLPCPRVTGTPIMSSPMTPTPPPPAGRVLPRGAEPGRVHRRRVASVGDDERYLVPWRPRVRVHRRCGYGGRLPRRDGSLGEWPGRVGERMSGGGGKEGK